MSKWGNSKELTQASYGLVREHQGMNRWAVRAAIHGAAVGGIGVLIGLALMFGGEVMDANAGDAGSGAGVAGIGLGVVIVVLALIAGLTAANLQLAGLVRVTDDVLHGREPDEQAARDAARSRVGTLTAWSAISVAMSGLVAAIRGGGQGGVVSSIVRSLLAGVVAVVWSVVTTLVMPVIVLEQAGSVAAIKRSTAIIRTTWGEALLGSVRIGARFFLVFTLPGLLLLVGGIALGIIVGGVAIGAGVLMALVGLALIVVGAVKAATCRTVFGVALYRWAIGDGAMGPFSEADLRGAVAVKDGAVKDGAVPVG